MDVSKYIDRKPRNTAVDNIHSEGSQDLKLYEAGSSSNSLSDLSDSKESVDSFGRVERESCTKINLLKPVNPKMNKC
ncbi:hypothetical protein CRE_21907 [Caenorhabditis remanei]|nr:hypothetical protein CRE_21907 [Caenorhabditis remanei]